MIIRTDKKHFSWEGPFKDTNFLPCFTDEGHLAILSDVSTAWHPETELETSCPDLVQGSSPGILLPKHILMKIAVLNTSLDQKSSFRMQFEYYFDFRTLLGFPLNFQGAL